MSFELFYRFMINDIGIIFAAGGSSNRYGRNKLFEQINGKPLFIWTICNFCDVCRAEHAVLVVPESLNNEFSAALNRYLPGYPLLVTNGGQERSDSVQNGLKALPSNVAYVAIHDAARPQADQNLLLECLETARKYGGAIPGKPVTDTIKKVDEHGMITATVDRNGLWRVETPQVFRRDLLENAYRQADKNFTDDAAVMEHASCPVKMVYNPVSNIKVTYPEDLAVLNLPAD